jgi:ferredoxin
MKRRAACNAVAANLTLAACALCVRKPAHVSPPLRVTREPWRATDQARFRFDAARCVLCGICVRTARLMRASIAPAFQGRGLAAHIAPPLGRSWSEIPSEILSACAEACPTGAMALVPSTDREKQKNADRPERV